MKTKRIVALALAGALAFGGALATPVLADKAVATAEKELSKKDLNRAKEDVQEVLGKYIEEAKTKVADLTKAKADGKLEEKFNKAKADKDDADAELEKAEASKKKADDAYKQAKADKKYADDVLQIQLDKYGLKDGKAETIDARIEELKKTDQKKADALAAEKENITKLQEAADTAANTLKEKQDAVNDADNNVKKAKTFVSKAAKPYEDAKAALEKADKAIEEAEKARDDAQKVKDEFDIASFDPEDIKNHYDIAGMSAEDVVKMVFTSENSELADAFKAIVGGVPAPQPGEEPGKPGVEPGKPGVEPGKPGKPAEKPEVKGKDNKKDNKKAPKTGDITVLAYAGSAVLAAGAFVASKKRK